MPRPRRRVFEWARRGDRKRPFYFHMRDGEPFAIAGLWERWEGEAGPLETCTVLTTEANELLSPYHDRVLVRLGPDDYEARLDADVRRPELLVPLLRPYLPGQMSAYAVGALVNSHSNDGPRCVEPLSTA